MWEYVRNRSHDALIANMDHSIRKSGIVLKKH